MATSEVNWTALSIDENSSFSVVGRADPAHPPVFLHAGWRTGGTWLWSRFCTLPGVLGYYEPLHPDLATLDHVRIHKLDERHWTSGHPTLHAPYFEEFRPLLNDGAAGIRRFRSQFATKDFFSPVRADFPELSEYLRGLLLNALAQGRQPVLKFCRSLGRVEWMQRHFPHAVHAVVLRNPLEQFASARSQFIHSGNPYFLTMPWLLLAMQRDHPPVACALQRLGVVLPRIRYDAGLQDSLSICEAALGSVGADELYRIFLAFWILTVVDVPETTDLIINYDMLMLSSPYRRNCELDLQDLTGLPVNLSDIRCRDDDRLLDRVGLSRAQLWRCHRAAQDILAERSGTDWCDKPRFACAGALLQYATLLAMDGSTTLQATAFEQIARWGALTDRAATATQCTLRAAQAETRAAQAEMRAEQAETRAAQAKQQLAAVHASQSWRVTAPLRWLRSNFAGRRQAAE
jgi:hypothetical protein